MFFSRIAIAVCLTVIVLIEYVIPFVADLYYASEYRSLVVECDQAMHDEAALRPGTVSGEKDQRLPITATIGLAVCHDYDKLRKRLLAFGVSEDQLALHGLEALEIERVPVTRMVDPHRMGRF